MEKGAACGFLQGRAHVQRHRVERVDQEPGKHLGKKKNQSKKIKPFKLKIPLTKKNKKKKKNRKKKKKKVQDSQRSKRSARRNLLQILSGSRDIPCRHPSLREKVVQHLELGRDPDRRRDML
jgi:hypothetical protein